jgi:hypothetical protein
MPPCSGAAVEGLVAGLVAAPALGFAVGGLAVSRSRVGVDGCNRFGALGVGVDRFMGGEGEEDGDDGEDCEDGLVWSPRFKRKEREGAGVLVVLSLVLVLALWFVFVFVLVFELVFVLESASRVSTSKA